MTEKLKTLKDFGFIAVTDRAQRKLWVKDIGEIRQEAIKWVKYFRKTGNCYNGLIQFFNITEAELNFQLKSESGRKNKNGTN